MLNEENQSNLGEENHFRNNPKRFYEALYEELKTLRKLPLPDKLQKAGELVDCLSVNERLEFFYFQQTYIIKTEVKMIVMGLLWFQKFFEEYPDDYTHWRGISIALVKENTKLLASVSTTAN